MSGSRFARWQRGGDALLGSGRPLRVVHAAACPFPSPQGSQVYVHGMARALARRGHHVTVACYGHGLGAVDPSLHVVRTPRLPGYRRLRAGPDWVKPLLDLTLVRTLVGCSADLVHAHNYEAALAALVARRWTGVPVVYSAHTIMREELPTYFQRTPWRLLAQALGSALDVSVPRRANHALGLTATTTATLRSLGCTQVSWLPPGVDAHDLRPARPARLPPGPWVVCAGNPDAYQDLYVLMRAMRQLPEARLLLVMSSPMDGATQQAPRGTRCVVTTDFDRVRSLLAAADVAALPRAVCSGYPMKLLNYLGMGLPTVAATGSVLDLPGVVAVPGRDPHAMAQALRALLADPSALLALGRDARSHVLEHCGWDLRALQLESVYRRILRAPTIGGADSGPLTL